MRTILLAAGPALAALSIAASAQDQAPAAPAPGCYIEIHKLMAEPPAGIGELGAAIRALDTQLRPQVEEINALKAQIARLERREVAAAPATTVEAAFEDEDAGPSRTPPPADERTAEEIRRAQAELDAHQARLKLDYAAQQRALLGPVQARISRGAQAFAAGSGCTEVRMARAPDLAALTSAGARNVTGEFVAWYLANPPA
jgi:Skp family chaperone for outer membrane proteins